MKKVNLRLVKKSLLILFSIYVLYAFIFGVVVFAFHHPEINTGSLESPVDNITGGGSNDRVVLLEEEQFAGLARINLIENAEESIDIAYHTTHPGVAANLFFTSVLDAADRGVQVRIVLDGLFHNLRGKNKMFASMFQDHPNITLQLYEPLHLLKPWTWNNRLHDKLVIIDNQYAIIGGRNIGDRYFIKNERTKFDRDVLIIRPDMSNDSSITDIASYFDELWNHPFTKKSTLFTHGLFKEKRGTQLEEARFKLNEEKAKYPHLFNQSVDWLEFSIATNQINFVHNPLQRWNKEPTVWQELTTLMATAKESVTMESPYIILTEEMLDTSAEISFPDEVAIYTNSLATSTNLLAQSGSTHYKQPLLDKGFSLFEYQGPGAIHGKTYIIDDHLSAIGTFNLDPRSAFLSTESMVIIESEELAQLLKQNMQKRYENSILVGDSNEVPNHVQLGEVSLLKKMLEKILSITLKPLHFLL